MMVVNIIGTLLALAELVGLVVGSLLGFVALFYAVQMILATHREEKKYRESIQERIDHYHKDVVKPLDSSIGLEDES